MSPQAELAWSYWGRVLGLAWGHQGLALQHPLSSQQAGHLRSGRSWASAYSWSGMV